MKFKNASGAYLTQGLFFETAIGDKSQVVYTLKEQDHLGYPSLYRLYMETGDLLEYDFAVLYLDGWTHWERIAKAPWFKPYVTAWRKELELKVRAAALKRMQTRAASGDKDSLQADKFLLTGQWKPTGSNRRGAPSKQEIKDEAHRIASVDSQLSDDLDRLKGLN